MDLNKFKEWQAQYPWLIYVLAGSAFILLWLMPFHGKKTAAVSAAPVSSAIGISVGEGDEKAYIARIEKNYYDFEDRIAAVEKRTHGMALSVQRMEDNQKAMSRSILALENNLSSQITDHFKALRQQLPVATIPKHAHHPMALAVADVKPLINKQDGSSVYLPLGSFCEGTLLTGVYATADQNNPLPVLISLDEAFYGPNQTRIPLKGAFVLGKAYGDLVSERALIQVIAISSVLPSSVTFESEQNLGYVTDQNGELGIHGQVVRNTGRELATSFVSGFMSGGAQALADQQVSEHWDNNGNLVKDVTGDTTKNAMFSGLARSSAKLSDYYAQQAENLVPAVHVHNGQHVYFIVQKGVLIHGLSRMDVPTAHYMD